MAKFHVKAKSGIVFFEKNTKTGKNKRVRAEVGDIIDLTESQCKFYAAKGEVLPEQSKTQKPDKK